MTETINQRLMDSFHQNSEIKEQIKVLTKDIIDQKNQFVYCRSAIIGSF